MVHSEEKLLTRRYASHLIELIQQMQPNSFQSKEHLRSAHIEKLRMWTK